MTRATRNNPPTHRIDLETVRETLAYMHSDMGKVPALTAVSKALAEAIAAIDSATRSSVPTGGGAPHLADRPSKASRASNVVSLPKMNFVPWQPPR
ncbi:MAG: hypothetical protein R3D67_17900 [Hyphomicrobiaceae bacterium]